MSTINSIEEIPFIYSTPHEYPMSLYFINQEPAAFKVIFFELNYESTLFDKKELNHKFGINKQIYFNKEDIDIINKFILLLEYSNILNTNKLYIYLKNDYKFDSYFNRFNYPIFNIPDYIKPKYNFFGKLKKIDDDKQQYFEEEYIIREGFVKLNEILCPSIEILLIKIINKKNSHRRIDIPCYATKVNLIKYQEKIFIYEPYKKAFFEIFDAVDIYFNFYRYLHIYKDKYGTGNLKVEKSYFTQEELDKIELNLIINY